jgi:hypothetical protein
MDIHKNAPLTPKGRETMVRSVVKGGLSKAATAQRYCGRRDELPPSHVSVPSKDHR